MSGFELVAGVIGIFFVTGIAMGALLVTALPRMRGRSGRKHVDGGGWHQSLSPHRYDERRPRWPGE